MAARALSVAEPSTLLVDLATRAALEGDGRFVARSQQAYTLKGFDELVPLSAVGRASGR